MLWINCEWLKRKENEKKRERKKKKRKEPKEKNKERKRKKEQKKRKNRSVLLIKFLLYCLFKGLFAFAHAPRKRIDFFIF